jgi:hypothetical protein
MKKSLVIGGTVLALLFTTLSVTFFFDFRVAVAPLSKLEFRVSSKATSEPSAVIFSTSASGIQKFCILRFLSREVYFVVDTPYL